MCEIKVSAGMLKWKCRRGMLELDILVTRYLDRAYEKASVAEQSAFLSLLELEDPVLASWMLKGQPAENPLYQNIVDTALALHAG